VHRRKHEGRSRAHARDAAPRKLHGSSQLTARSSHAWGIPPRTKGIDKQRRSSSNRHVSGGSFRKLSIPTAGLSFGPQLSLVPPSISLNLSGVREELAIALVYSPGTRPTAIIHFVGGSFIGAAPDFFYGYLIKLLVDRGFLDRCDFV